MSTPSRSNTPVLALLAILALASVAKAGIELTALRLATDISDAQLGAIDTASRLSSLNWRYPLRQAGLLAASGRHEAALGHYREALKRFPGCGVCWIGLAESELALGHQHETSLLNAIHFGRSMTAVRTRAGVMYFRLGEEKPAKVEFAAALGGQRFEKDDFFMLLHRMFDRVTVLEEIVPVHTLGPYLDFAIRRLDPDSTRMIWDHFSENGVSEERRHRYARHLAKHGRYSEAWSLAIGDESPRLLNADFESPGESDEIFGWQLTDEPGVRARIVQCARCPEGDRALRLRFDGNENPRYQGISQTVPLEAGRSYRVATDVMYEELTSAEGVRLFVVGVSEGTDSQSSYASECRMQSASDELHGSSGWRQVSVDFYLPEGCSAVRLEIGRRRAEGLDRYIGGEIWFDNFSLEARPEFSKSVGT